MSNNNQAGKGSKPRPVDKKEFDNNFDEIAWKKTTAIVSTMVKKGKITYKY